MKNDIKFIGLILFILLIGFAKLLFTWLNLGRVICLLFIIDVIWIVFFL